MPIFKYFTDERFADRFIRLGEMRFGSPASFRLLEDGGRRGDPTDGALHYAPSEGLEITRLSDGEKLSGVSFTSAAAGMFIFCVSNELSAHCAEEFGPFCVEIANADCLIARVKARADAASMLDYGQTLYGPVEYRSFEKMPGVDWAIPEKLVLMKPDTYVRQNESRIVVPLKAGCSSNGSSLFIRVGKLKDVTKLHRF